MDYEKKYKEALEWVRKVMEGKVGFVLDEVLEKFPELKDSEDEKIRKTLKHLVETHSEFYGNEWMIGDFTQEQCIAWLEKQGENLRGKSTLEASKEEKVDNRNYVKPINNIEPKFKVDDWIVNKGHSYLIGYIDYEQRRYLFEIGGYTHEQLNWEYIENADKKYHLWTIQDAKDGDVLVASDGSIFLFNWTIDWACKHYVAYVALDNTVKFNDGLKHYWETSTEVHPATKEQRDLLFQKMKEAGYEWDAEKKELRKIKQNSDWSEEDEMMICIIATDLQRGQTKRVLKHKIDWLQSLKEKVNLITWKPSEEQIQSLQESIGIVGELTPRGECLKELVEQLKKLIEG